MPFTRNRYFLIGVLLIMLGVQLRMVHSVVLTEDATRALFKLSKQAPVASSNPNTLTNFFMQVTPTSPKKQIAPPRWLGLAMIAAGSVVSLHALAMPRQT